jgi:Zn finger protein HypA/HybF involved in hydrogenase expression
VKHPYAADGPYASGETVTPGKFECTACGHRLVIEEPTITNLPVCPECQADTWRSA